MFQSSDLNGTTKIAILIRCIVSPSDSSSVPITHAQPIMLQVIENIAFPLFGCIYDTES